MKSEPLILNNKVVESFGDKSLSSIFKKALNKAGSPTNIGLGVTALSFLPTWLALKYLVKDHAALKALGISGALGLASGILTTPFNRDPRLSYGDQLLGIKKNKNQRDIDYVIDSLPFKRTKNGYMSRFTNDVSSKEAADFFANMPNTDKLTLHDVVNSAPGFTPPQKDFLHNGIYNAPSNQPNIADLTTGFINTVDTVTGGLLPASTRAIEGALIGSAFSGIMGLKPGTHKFAVGAATVVNSLYGNKLFNTIKQVY